MLRRSWILTFVAMGLVGSVKMGMVAGQAGGGRSGTVPSLAAARAGRGATPAAPTGRGGVTIDQEPSAVTAKFGNGTQLTLVALGSGQMPQREGPWWAPDGTVRAAPELPNFGAKVLSMGGSAATPVHIEGIIVVLRATDGGEDLREAYVHAKGRNWEGLVGTPARGTPPYITINTQPYTRQQGNPGTLDIHFEAALEGWTYYHARFIGGAMPEDPDGIGASTFYSYSTPDPKDWGVSIDTFDKFDMALQRKVFVQVKGSQTVMKSIYGMPLPGRGMNAGGFFKVNGATFLSVREGDVAGLWLGVRPLRAVADIKNISLHPGQKQTVEVETKLNEDLPMREAAAGFVRAAAKREAQVLAVPAEGGAGIKNVEGLRATVELADGKVDEAWVDQDQACAVVKNVERVGDAHTIWMGLRMVRREKDWKVMSFALLGTEKEVTEYVEAFRQKAAAMK